MQLFYILAKISWQITFVNYHSNLIFYEKQFLRKQSGLSDGLHANPLMGGFWSRPKSDR